MCHAARVISSPRISTSLIAPIGQALAASSRCLGVRLADTSDGDQVVRQLEQVGREVDARSVGTTQRAVDLYPVHGSCLLWLRGRVLASRPRR